MKDIYLGLFVIVVLGYCKYFSKYETIDTLPNESIEQRYNKPIQAGIAPTEETQMDIDRLTGFYRGDNGTKVFIDLTRELLLFASDNKSYSVTIAAIGSNYVVVKYDNTYSPDIIRLEKGGKISFAAVKDRDSKTYFTKINN